MPEQQYTTLHLANNWQQQLAEAFTNLQDLCLYLHLSVEELPASVIAAKNFPLRVPLSFAACIKKNSPHDPLLRQVLPIKDELLTSPGFSNDPTGDLKAATEFNFIHKYHGRVLFINTGSCAINCRYCFRRNFPYSDLLLGREKEQEAINKIQKTSSISEVILSGGDPLLLSDNRLYRLVEQLGKIKHLKRIRIHSRLPIVLPARITAELIDALTISEKKIIVVTHCNHANELNERVFSACTLLKNNNITLLNQSVLLKGVNDDAAVLCDLSEQLFFYGILPYYLHLLDKATGTQHFEVSEPEAIKLIKCVQTSLPGYLVPRLVKEQMGEAFKQHISN